MRDTVLTLAFADDEGRPDGGISDGPGFTVSWQRGPLVLPDGTELPRNGAFVEEVLGACRDRLVTYQDSPFACEENAEALEHINAALEALAERQRNRQARGVAGTHTP